MANEDRREFLKRLGVGSAVVAGSLGFVAITSPNKHRGATDVNNNGVVVGSSTKVETLYQKTEYWEKFYKSAI